MRRIQAIETNLAAGTVKASEVLLEGSLEGYVVRGTHLISPAQLKRKSLGEVSPQPSPASPQLAIPVTEPKPASPDPTTDSIGLT